MFRLEFERIDVDVDVEGLEFEKEFFFERLVEENMNKEGGEWTREEEEGTEKRKKEEDEGKLTLYFYFNFIF